MAYDLNAAAKQVLASLKTANNEPQRLHVVATALKLARNSVMKEASEGHQKLARRLAHEGQSHCPGKPNEEVGHSESCNKQTAAIDGAFRAIQGASA